VGGYSSAASCFPLFPFSNRIVNGRFEFEGEAYSLPINMPPEPHAIHGSAWQKEAIVTDYSTNYLKIIHQQSSEEYPFQFSAIQEWRIKDGVVEVSLELINTMVPMSVAKTPEEWDFSKGLKVSSSSMDNCYMQWGRKCKINWPELNTKLSLTASDVFENMVVYIPTEDDFFCLEPVTNVNDGYNNELELQQTGLVNLSPGDNFKGHIRFKFG